MKQKMFFNHESMDAGECERTRQQTTKLCEGKFNAETEVSFSGTFLLVPVVCRLFVFPRDCCKCTLFTALYLTFTLNSLYLSVCIVQTAFISPVS